MSGAQPRIGQLVGQKLGKYELVAPLAVGGTAEIYIAKIAGEHGFEKYVVVKVLLDHLVDDADFVRMFLDEARLGAQLDHSNIVQTLELGEQDGRYYMVMEFLAGMSVAQVARKAYDRLPGGLLPVDMVLALAAQACTGLNYAHKRKTVDGRPLNVVHRDISPQNLVVTFDGVLKLVDFGIAKAEQRQTNTESGTIKGKFAYMSPEQCMAKEVDWRTDIFALGVVCHELLTGRRLFKRNSTYETYQAIVSGKVPPPSVINHRLDHRIDDVLLKALSFEREKRYASSEDFGTALMEVLHKRGRSISSGDISRFFEEHFADDLEAHGERMRELIESKGTETNITALEELGWATKDGDEEEDELELPGTRAGKMAVSERGPTALAIDTGGNSDAGAGAGADAGADSQVHEGADATRIELNPLGRVQQMHAGQGTGPVELSEEEILEDEDLDSRPTVNNLMGGQTGERRPTAPTKPGRLEKPVWGGEPSIEVDPEAATSIADSGQFASNDGVPSVEGEALYGGQPGSSDISMLNAEINSRQAPKWFIPAVFGGSLVIGFILTILLAKLFG